MLKSGTLLSGRYRIQSTLGQGGMGAVYLGKMEALEDKLVAIKEMEMTGHCPKEVAQAVQQFKKEASFLANLEHPNLVRVTDFFEAGNKHYLVMAYIEGQTLQEKMADLGRPFSWAEVKPWAQDLLAVLAYLHNQSPAILFRDLKPSNIMISTKGRLHLIDFGIARTNSDTDRTSTFLQGTGTRGFSPIEQYGQGQSTDQRSDVYALGATLYYLLTGRVPTDAVSRVSQEQDLLPPTAYAPHLPKGLDEVILKSMSLSRRDRHGSMAEFNRHLCRVESWENTEVEFPPFEPSPVRPPTSITVEVFPSVSLGRSAQMQKNWLVAMVTCLICFLALGLKPPGPPRGQALWTPTERPSPRQVLVSQAAEPRLAIAEARVEEPKVSPENSPQTDTFPEEHPTAKIAPKQGLKQTLTLSLGQESYPKAKRLPAPKEEDTRTFGPALAYVEPDKPTPQATKPETVQTLTTTTGVASTGPSTSSATSSAPTNISTNSPPPPPPESTTLAANQNPRGGDGGQAAPPGGGNGGGGGGPRGGGGGGGRR